MIARASIRRKVLALVLLTTLAAVLVAIGAMVANDLNNYRRTWVGDLTTQAGLLAQTTAPALAFDDARVARENLALLRLRPKVRAGAVYNTRGKIFASFARDEGHEFPALPQADGVKIRGDELVVFKRVVSDDEILGSVYISADYELYARLLNYLGISAAVALLAMLVAYGLSIPMQRAVTRPLFEIARVAREVTEKRNFSLRAKKASEDEIGSLAEAFNTMLAEIERSTRDLEASNREVLRLNAELEQRVSERTEQLQYTNKELEAFCYSVSHDLRAPLRAIDGFSQALVEDFPRDIPEEGTRYLARIRSSVQRMSQLIEDLLNLSKVSRAQLAVQDVDVSALARQVLGELQAGDPQRRVEVNVWDGMRAQADARLLRTAFENLVSNAWKFTSKCESATIEAGCLRDGAQATFFIRDNGAGFDMAYADKLFGAFQRLHATTDFAGTGIGLATVQRIVHRHGGRIWAEAAPGRGAVFYFTLGGAQA